MLTMLESVNPLHDIGEGYWKEVYAEVRGTLLVLYRLKDKQRGRVLRSYTLQHAEIGLAPDSEHTVLIPQTRLAHLVPPFSREKAWRRDKKMYKAEPQHIVRLRVESDQFLLANSSEDMVHDFIEALSAAIDISHPIDERSQAKQCTMPRRRRRPRPQPEEATNDFNDPAFLAEQERIMRQHFPGLMEGSMVPAIDSTPVTAEQTGGAAAMSPTGRTQSQSTPREDEELDLSLLAEDGASPGPYSGSELRPVVSRITTASTVVEDPIREASIVPSNVDADGKWAPPHNRSAAQAQRYIRRCLPLLNSDAIRASDVLIYQGRRVKINWRMLSLENWELLPPSYASHVDATPSTPLERSSSQSSSAAASTDQPPASEPADEIQPLETPTIEVSQQGAELVKSNSNFKEENKPMSTTLRPMAESKALEARNADSTAVHGAVVCF